MLTIRFCLALKWLAWKVLRPLGFKDRWGFNLGEDLHDWASVRMFAHIRKLEGLAGFNPVEPSRGPRVRITQNPTGMITSSATGTTSTWSMVF